jgi:polyisoprenoid-binding protein YceI
MVKSIVPVVALAGFGLMAQACDNPARETAELSVSEAKGVAAEAPVAPGSVRYVFDAAGSRVAWVGSKVTGSHEGGFQRFEGSIELSDGKPESGRVKVRLDANSLYSDNAKLTRHLKSADFFDVEKYPNVTFTSTSVEPTSAGNYSITGDLNLHGVTKSVSFPAKLRVSAGALEGEAEFSFNRRDFGINYAGMANDLIRDEVLVRLSIRGRRGSS